MRTYLFTLMVLLSSYLYSQVDPFYTEYSQFGDAAFSSPSEAPEFKPFISDLDVKSVKVTYIEPFDLKSLMDTRSRIFLIDTREEYEYNFSHIKGSKRISYNTFNIEKVWMFDRNTTVILYSTEDICCIQIAAYMKMLGFIDVRILNRGLVGWVKSGYYLEDKSNNMTNSYVYGGKVFKKPSN